MRVLVTGASGFIGLHTVNQLKADGHHPVGFDHRRSEGSDVFLGDVRDPTAVTEAMAHVDGFVHLAAVLGTQETIANPRPSAETNIFGTLNILEAAAQYGVPGVYICVGNHWMNNTYSITKTAGERFVAMFNAERGTWVNAVRCVNAYGPGQRAAVPFASGRVRKITPAFACRALAGMPIEVYGDGLQVSDMLYVTDLAEVLVSALVHAVDGPSEQVIEAGPLEHHTVNEVAELVGTEAAKYTGRPFQVAHLPMRPGEVPGDVVTADTSTLKVIDIDPARFVPLDKGMARTVKWFADTEGQTWQRPTAGA